MRHLQIISLLFFTCVLAACGFHLRGTYDLPEHLSPLFIDKGLMSLQLYLELRAALIASGIDLTDVAVTSAFVLDVNREHRSRDVILVDTLGRAREYRLIYRLEFSLQASGESLIDKSNIQLTRNLLFDPETVLGVAQEQEYVYDDMIRDSASQVLQKLQALK